MRVMRASLLAAAASTLVAAQRPANTSICDYYTTALLKNNTADNQYTLLTLLVNTVVIGNYTMPNVGVKVPGILAPGEFNGTKVNLLPYFNGQLASSNRGGSMGVSVNFLDGGGADPLMKNMPANDKTSSQYFLLTHLYQFFGSLLGCSMQGMPGFAAYMGEGSMNQVHKFMDLNPSQLGYFITQVALAGASFGVAQDDLVAVGTALGGLFGMRCSAPATAIPAQGAQLQAICIDDTCPLATNAVCASYEPVVRPMNATSTSMAATATSGAGGGGGMMPTSAMTMTGGTMMTTTMRPTGVATAGAVAHGVNLAAAVAGVAAFLI